MRTSKILEPILFFVAFLFCSIGMNAQSCDITDDLASGFTSFSTPNGWTCNQHVSQYLYDGIYYTVLDGSEGTPDAGIGVLKSPVLSNGCNSLSFSWDWEMNDPGEASFKLELKKGEIIVWNDIITDHSAEPFVTNTVSYNDLKIEGEVQLVITNLKTAQGYPVLNGIGLWNFCIKNYAVPIIIPAHNFQFNVPKDATVFVGDKDQTVTVAGNYLTKHYVPFTKQTEVFIAETDTSKIWYYNLPAPKNASGGFNYRVTRAGKAPHVGLFKPKTGTTVESDTLLGFTDAQLSLYDAKDIDHNVNSFNGRNVADIFININAQGFLTLPLREDTTFQLIHTRNWQAIDTDVNNYFIEPDFHYTVVDENGQPSNSVITVSDSGLITPVGAGTAIVLVDYDAMLCHHTTNVGVSNVKTNPAFFSALWPENSAVFVVAVNAPEANIKSNMLINEYWSELNGTDKVDSTLIDAELDVLYFEADKGSFPYTFKPEGVTGVEVATPTVGTSTLSYSGFVTDSVTANTDGSYTVRLGFGRNIVKLISATGAEYQIITAKPVTYIVTNISDPGQAFQPGDSVSVLFNTLYHPCNKMSGIYNMSSGIQYTGADVNFPLILGPGQYTFASRAQEYIIVIPDTITSNKFDLTQGVLKVKGFGSNYGAHRNITLQSGVAPNLNASVRTGYFGALPEIRIPLQINDITTPTVPTELTGTPTETTIALSWTASTDNVGVTGYNVYIGDVLSGTVTGTSYTATGLTAATDYTFSVEAIDAAGNKSAKALATLSTSTATGIPLVSENNISVFPNPFDSFIVLEAKTDSKAVIYDLTGKPVLQVNVYSGINRINTSALGKGVYVLKYGLNSVRIVK
ncbi:MAG: T9SS type A sorting domain-containing protein [Bacteroidales bacterium]|nr:T9SS type A sorting domain-containing protein [Bacteroidales bacterium]